MSGSMSSFSARGQGLFIYPEFLVEQEDFDKHLFNRTESNPAGGKPHFPARPVDSSGTFLQLFFNFNC